MFGNAFGSFPASFGMFGVMFTVVFVLILGVILVTLVRSIGQWSKNNHSPRLTVDAKVVAKRTNVSRHHHSGGANHVGHTSASTTYYVTFEVASGDRMELRLQGHEYGLLVEGDRGELTFQGTRFLGFRRKVSSE